MIKPMLRLAGVGLLGGALVSGCSSGTSTTVATPTDAAPAQTAVESYARPSQDGAPWWDVDVSKIPDAVPRPHYGPLKAAPYTVLGKTYYPFTDTSGYSVEGTASWYGTKFHGQATANGEAYDLYGMTAAHKTLPLPCYARVTNLANGRSVIVRVNDRGPFYSERVIDLSFAAAKKLGYAEKGTARVRVEAIDPEQWWAARGQTPPTAVLADAPRAGSAAVSATEVENYTPPAAQHAVFTAPVAATAPAAAAATSGVFLQVGAFANPDAAELLREKLLALSSAPVFISSVSRQQQVLHRVRIGPIASLGEASQLEQQVRQANLGTPRRVVAD